MQTERRVSLFRNGRNQALRIPREFELEGTEAIIRKEGDQLIICPVEKPGLLSVLADMKPWRENFPDIPDSLVEAEDIF